ncbi:MAG: hypothetical protein LBD18_07335 [Treponema sp.]|nr:hypothetical protein [Treponema sp.]
MIWKLRACSKFYLAGSKRARKSGFLWSIDRKNPQFEQALKVPNQSCQKRLFKTVSFGTDSIANDRVE